MALSHINIRTRNKKSAGVLIIREPQAHVSGRINYTRGRPCKKNIEKIFEKNSQCQKLSHSAENESVQIFIH